MLQQSISTINRNHNRCSNLINAPYLNHASSNVFLASFHSWLLVLCIKYNVLDNPRECHFKIQTLAFIFLFFNNNKTISFRFCLIILEFLVYVWIQLITSFHIWCFFFFFLCTRFKKYRALFNESCALFTGPKVLYSGKKN